MIEIDLHKKLHSSDGIMHLEIDATIEKGDFVTLYGESGVGKTSLLRMIAGLLPPDSGRLRVGDQWWYDSEKRVSLATQKRNIGFVFQDYALFPNMTVEENLLFAMSDKKEQTLLKKIIEITELQNLLKQKPEVLSGGQKQRVALGRAIVQKPNILLLDEPLSALDNKMRIRLQDQIHELHKEFELTTIMVSHDVGEILRLSNKLIQLKNGKVCFQGKPEELFANESISAKFRFMGEVLKIERQDAIFVVSVIIQNNLIKVVAEQNEITDLKKGDKVMVASKAFNPIIYKIDD